MAFNCKIDLKTLYITTKQPLCHAIFHFIDNFLYYIRELSDIITAYLVEIILYSAECFIVCLYPIFVANCVSLVLWSRECSWYKCWDFRGDGVSDIT